MLPSSTFLPWCRVNGIGKLVWERGRVYEEPCLDSEDRTDSGAGLEQGKPETVHMNQCSKDVQPTPSSCMRLSPITTAFTSLSETYKKLVIVAVIFSVYHVIKLVSFPLRSPPSLLPAAYSSRSTSPSSSSSPTPPQSP